MTDELREQMLAAWEKEEADQGGEEDQEILEEETEAGEEETPDIEDPEQEEETEPEQESQEEPTLEAAQDTEQAPKRGRPKKEKNSAPASWSPKARESWGSIPADAQKQILARDKQVNEAMRVSAEARKGIAQLNATLAPYKEGLIAAGAKDPLQAVSTLLNTEASLRTGNSTQKAQVISNLINQYGVDIGTLDNMLTGNPQAQQQSVDPNIQDIIDQKMAPFNQYMQQQAYHQQQEMLNMQSAADQKVTEFSTGKEFINDVRGDMAILMQSAADSGKQMTLDQAYDIACNMNPEIASIMKDRQAQQTIMNANKTAQAKRGAAVSLTGRKGGEGGGNTNMSLRDTLANAWENQNSY